MGQDSLFNSRDTHESIRIEFGVKIPLMMTLPIEHFLLVELVQDPKDQNGSIRWVEFFQVLELS
jgi:hypothetical protein